MPIISASNDTTVSWDPRNGPSYARRIFHHVFMPRSRTLTAQNKYSVRIILIWYTSRREIRRIRGSLAGLRTHSPHTGGKKITCRAVPALSSLRGDKGWYRNPLRVAGWLRASWRGGGGRWRSRGHVALRRIVSRGMLRCVKTLAERTLALHYASSLARSHSRCVCTRHASRLTLASPPYRRILVGAAVFRHTQIARA